MKSARIILALFLLCWSTPSSPLQGAAPPPRTLVITGVTVIDATGKAPRPDTTVLIRGDRIVALGKTGQLAVPAAAQVVDGRGKYLIPGLWDMHVHVVHDRFRQLFLAHGITGVRHMYTPNPWCSPRRWRAQAGTLLAPRLVLSDSMVDGARPALPLLLRANVHSAANERAARQVVHTLKGRGEDFIKVYTGLSEKAFLALLDEAGKQRMAVAGHVPHAVNVGVAAQRGMRCVEHLSGVALACSRQEAVLRSTLVRDMEAGRLTPLEAATAWRFQVKAYRSLDPSKVARLIQVFARNGTWHCPTLLEKRAWERLEEESFTRDGRLASLPPLVRNAWKVKRSNGGVSLPRLGMRFSYAELGEHAYQFRKDLEMVEALHRAGVRLLAGTDTPNPYCFPGSGLHDELKLLVKAGLTPLEALQTATRNPGEFLGRQQELGTVEAGKLADLVVLEADPLKHIGNTRQIAAVILGGKLLDQRQLRAMSGQADPTRPRE
jgi:imidazolonepropionase-like amidohydrolase